jgi:hypothetical protein
MPVPPPIEPFCVLLFFLRSSAPSSMLSPTGMLALFPLRGDKMAAAAAAAMLFRLERLSYNK